MISTFMRPGRDEAWKQTLAQDQIEAFAYQCDVGDYEQCQQLVSTIKQQHGHISVLVNNTGITADDTLRKMSPDNGTKSFKPTSTRYLIPANW